MMPDQPVDTAGVAAITGDFPVSRILAEFTGFRLTGQRLGANDRPVCRTR
jgi:hypothetical protein